MKKSLMLLLLLLFAMSLFAGCGSSEDEDGDVDGDQEASVDGDDETADGDQEFVCSGTCSAGDSKCMDSDLCYCLNGQWTNYVCDTVCTEKGQVSKGCGVVNNADNCICEDNTDGDEEGETSGCSGTCDANTAAACYGANSVCACDSETLELVEVDCDDVCKENGADGSEQCYTDTDGPSCVCYTQECQSNADCTAIDVTKPTCVSMGQSSYCVSECDMNTCSATVGCMDTGYGDKCGVCWDLANASSCTTIGDTCGTDGVCTDVCGVFSTSPYCLETCEAAPNTCAANETCMPLATDAQGTIGTGFCFAWSDLNCDTCGENMVDGDAELEAEVEAEEELEAEVEAEVEVEAEAEEAVQ